MLTRSQIKFAIYLLVDPRDDSVIYVGQSNDPYRRFRAHIAAKGHMPLTLRIDELVNQGLCPLLRIAKWVNQEVADWEEIVTLKHYESLGHKPLNRKRNWRAPRREIAYGYDA